MKLGKTELFRKVLKCKFNRRSDRDKYRDDYYACPAFITLSINRY